MTTRLWDNAAALPARSGERVPQVAALAPGEPSVAELFTFMRDAELRFETLRMRIVELAWGAAGEQRTEIDVAMRHPGHARVLVTQPGEKALGDYEIWLADGDIVRTYSSRHKLGTQRPIRNKPRGLGDPDLPGASKVYEPLTALPTESLPETFIHPAGYCQNVLSTGACQVTGPEVIGGRETIGLTCLHPRTTELTADRPDYTIRIAVDRDTGAIIRLTESIGSEVTRDAEVVSMEPDAVLQPTTFDFAFPTGTTMLY